MRGTRIGAVAAAAVAVAAALAGTQGSASMAAPAQPVFTPAIRSDNPTLQKTPTEPATIIDTAGRRYVANQLDSELAITEDGGKTWRYPHGDSVLAQNVEGCAVSAGGLIGDVELATDSGGRTYFSTLGILDGGTADNGIQPLVAYSDDGFKTWHTKCAAHNPFMTDRQWLATYAPPGTPSDQTKLYLTYHDFGPDTMWVNRSADGGKTWMLPQVVITDPEAIASSGCDTVPGGIAVDQRNGWIYISWVAGPQPVNNAATGCNYTQGTIFNKYYVAFSKDNGVTWSNVKTFEGLDNTTQAPNDLSEIFSNIAVDRQGNVYVAYPAFLNGEYGIYYQWAKPSDTGNLQFSAPRKVSSGDAHTAYYPRMVAGDDGRIALIYLGTPYKNVPATATNKANVHGGGDGAPDCSPEVAAPGDHGVRFLGKPCMLPDDTKWYLYLATSFNATTDGPVFENQKMRPDSVHPGDICTLGIFCLGGDNRDLADVNDIKVDATGGIQVAYTYEAPDAKSNQIIFQCQVAGPGLYAGVTPKSCQSKATTTPPKKPTTPRVPPKVSGGQTTMPTTGLPGWLAVAALGAAGAAVVTLRARRRAA